MPADTANPAGRETFGDSTDHLVAERVRYEDCNAYRDEVANFVEVILDAAEPAIQIPFSRGNVQRSLACTSQHRKTASYNQTRSDRHL